LNSADNEGKSLIFTSLITVFLHEIIVSDIAAMMKKKEADNLMVGFIGFNMVRN
jgi:hypothetical protein